MCDVRHKLADKSELVALPIRNGVASLEECARQRFLIHEDPKVPSLQHVPELDDCRVYGEQFEVIGRVSGLSGGRSSAEETEGLEVSVDDLVDRACDCPGALVRVDA